MTDKNNKLSEYIPQKDTIEDQKFLDFEKPIQEISEKILALKNADIVVLLVDHKQFKSVNLNLLSSKQLIDTLGTWS